MSFSKGFNTMKKLEKFYEQHDYTGAGCVSTPHGPYFFDLAKIDPLDLAIGLHDEYDASWETVCDWLANVSDDCLH